MRDVTVIGAGPAGLAAAFWAGMREASVRVVDALPAIVAELDVAIGVIATPAGAAQEVADRLVQAGVRSVLNFAPAMIAVPPGVSVRKVDLAVELQILAYYEQRKATIADLKRRGRAVADLGGAATSRS